MSTEEPIRASPTPSQGTAMQVESTPAPDVADADENQAAGISKKRPRIDMAVEPRERKRGKTMFGLVLNTLTKAKTEDKQRNASEAAKKRQLIEQRLQDKLRKETDSVRRAEEAKKDKTNATRKEEELQLKDSIHKLRRTRLPLLSNFLLTSDVIPSDDSDASPKNPLAPPPRMRPPPLYYLPAKLLPSQEEFLQRRKAEVKEAAEKEWDAFKVERSTGVEDILKLRQRVAEESRRKAELAEEGEKLPADSSSPDKDDATMAVEGEKLAAPPTSDTSPLTEAKAGAGHMDVDEGATEKASEPQPTRTKDDEAKAEGASTVTKAAAPARGEEDDAVEY
ncbi:hypothetical protein C2E23DRAFT_809414 [Lenzites betulinus]|nr:hypothetical protein C2E23DRAFT_809414 [Lenzites betulinus]